jgi:hypothetical protein
MKIAEACEKTIVWWKRLLEEVQYVLRTISCPDCKKAMVCVL